MTIVTARPAQGRSVDMDSFTDLTVTPVLSIGWAEAGCVAIEFDGILTAAEVGAVRNRVMSSGPTDEATRNAIAAWTLTDDLAAQVERLTRIVLGLDQQPTTKET